MPELFYNRTITQVAINQSAAGAIDLVAIPGAGMKIYVVSVAISNSHSAVGTVKFTEGTGPTDLTGDMQLGIGGVLALFSDGAPILQTNTANSKLSLSSTTAFVDGWLRYFVAY